MQDGHDDAMQNAQQYYEGQPQELYSNLQESDKQLEFAQHQIEALTQERDKAKEEMERAVQLSQQKIEDLQDKVSVERKDLHGKLDQMTQ